MLNKQDENKSAHSFRAADESGIPVPSRFQIIEYLDYSEHPLKLKQMLDYFKLESQPEVSAALESRLNRLCHSGILLLDRKNRYGLSSEMDLVIGRVMGHANGFGFVIPDDGGEDLYLHHRQMRKVLHGDRVLSRVKRLNHRGKKEGSIVEVLIQPGRQIIGRFHLQKGSTFVEPDDVRFAREISVPKKHMMNARDGDIVIVEIIAHPVEHGHAVGKVDEIVGKELASGMETEIALRKHDIPYTWSPDMVNYISNNEKHFIASMPGKYRKNLCDLALVTIDGEDAKDFDDAVYCEPNQSGWRLVVAIADVSHYVTVNGELDSEAYRRGTSVYFPNRVVPMLPEALSNHICSLKPEENRNCLVCDMQVNPEGEVVKSSFYQAVMYSHARLTYQQVFEAVVKKDSRQRKAFGHLLSHLDHLYTLSKCLGKTRRKKGSIDFELPEASMEFDDNGKVSNIATTERNDAHRLIEECMLAANVCAAELLQEKLGDQAIYRNHEGPEEEALVDLRRFIAGFALKLDGGNKPSARDYALLLKRVGNRPEIKNVVQSVLLKSLSQATYGPEQCGHFALSFPIYTHFTSPIRRYSDLVVHRQIKNIIGIKGYKKCAIDGLSIGQVAEQCSFTERRADDASRDVLAWLKAEFMSDRVGEEFDGTISGVKEFGIFVQLSEFLVDGLVHVTNLGSDYYHFDPVLLELTGKRSNHRFKLGDSIRVKVSSVNMAQAKIDFELSKLKK